MNLFPPFFRLIRWPNLAFIVLTQVLFYCCIYLPLYGQPRTERFLLLVLASVFIAAAGYIINDYFDVNIDRVNKPEKNVVDSVIHRRWAIIWHLALSLAGVVLTAFAAGLSRWYLVPANLGCVLLLWFYSTSLKRKLLIGNVVISLLTAWTILILFFFFTRPSDAFQATNLVSRRFFRMAFLYAGFAFILSLVREAVKDMEDVEGDSRYGCKTLPIVAGVPATKIYSAVWLVVLIAVLLVLQAYVLQLGWWPSVVYNLAFIIIPLLLTLFRLRKTVTAHGFAQVSSYTKWIMLTGILSMIFFAFYF